MNSRWTLLALAATLTFAGAGCVDREAQKQAQATAKIVTDPTVEVAVVTPAVKPMQQSIVVTGEVTTSSDTQVGPKASGKLVAVYVNDGDEVRAGQVIAQMDTSTLNAQLNQAIAQQLSAQGTLTQTQAQLTQALRNQAVNPSKSSAAIRSAQAQLRSAQANLQKTLAGARPQERLQAQAQVASAKANLDTQSKQLDRIRNLVQQGALAGSQLDAQQATYEAAKTQYENAVQSLNLIKEGNRAEDIAAARESVRAAQEGVRTAQANQELDASLADQVAAVRAQIASAKAGVQAAQAAVAQARQAVSDATIRAPFSGTVSGKPVQVGTVLSPGSPIVRIVGTQGVYFEGDVPSEVVNQVQSGQPVEVSIDALQSRTFPAKVVTVGFLGSSIGRLFSARIGFIGAPPEIKPGMFARGTIQLRTVPNATTVPSTAIQKDDKGTSYVMTVSGDKAVKTPVQVGLTQGLDTQIIGLPTNAKVVVQGQVNLVDGAKVRVGKPAGASDSSAPPAGATGAAGAPGANA